MKNILLSENNKVIHIKLNRPEKRNAFNAEMIGELTDAFKRVDKNSARVVYLEGEGPSFCAGADLEWMKSIKDFSYEDNMKDSKVLFDMFMAVKKCPLPLITRVHGHVMGGANGLAAVSPLVAAENNTAFAFSEVKVGLVPAVISPFVLAKMNRSSAIEKMLTGRVFSVEEAQQGGLVQYVGDVHDVNMYIEKCIKRIKSAGPEAVFETAQLLHRIEGERDWAKLKEITAKVISERRVSEEGQEGLNAFFEKRNPKWQEGL